MEKKYDTQESSKEIEYRDIQKEEKANDFRYWNFTEAAKYEQVLSGEECEMIYFGEGYSIEQLIKEYENDPDKTAFLRAMVMSRVKLICLLDSQKAIELNNGEITYEEALNYFKKQYQDFNTQYGVSSEEKGNVNPLVLTKKMNTNTQNKK